MLTACLVLRYLEAGDIILRYGCRVCRGLKGLSATRVVGVCVCEPLRVEACWRQWSGWENRLTALVGLTQSARVVVGRDRSRKEWYCCKRQDCYCEQKPIGHCHLLASEADAKSVTAS